MPRLLSRAAALRTTMRKWGLWGHQWAQITASLLTVVSVTISMRHIRRHLNHGSDPYVVQVLLMVPVYSIEALLGLLAHQAAPLLEIARSVYEAYVIYAFLQLLVRRLPPGTAVASVPHLFPCRCALRRWSDEEFVGRVLRGALQYSLLMLPVMAATLGSWAGNRYERPSQFSPRAAYPYLATVRNLSQLWAMYCLALFYRATRAALSSFRPLGKFVCVKAIVFFTFWQGLLISYLGHLGYLSPDRLERGDVRVTWDQHDIGLGCQNFVIAVEMVGFAFAHRFAFPVADFPAAPGGRRLRAAGSLRAIWGGMRGVLRTPACAAHCPISAHEYAEI